MWFTYKQMILKSVDIEHYAKKECIVVPTSLFLRNDQVVQTRFTQRNRKHLKGWFYHRQQLKHGRHLAALFDDAFCDAGNRVLETMPETV
jgi:hypothetical protein